LQLGGGFAQLSSGDELMSLHSVCGILSHYDDGHKQPNIYNKKNNEFDNEGGQWLFGKKFGFGHKLIRHLLFFQPFFCFLHA
jgi:hypothetical protein